MIFTCWPGHPREMTQRHQLPDGSWVSTQCSIDWAKFEMLCWMAKEHLAARHGGDDE